MTREEYIKSLKDAGVSEEQFKKMMLPPKEETNI